MRARDYNTQKASGMGMGKKIETMRNWNCQQTTSASLKEKYSYFFPPLSSISLLLFCFLSFLVLFVYVIHIDWLSIGIMFYYRCLFNLKSYRRIPEEAERKKERKFCIFFLFDLTLEVRILCCFRIWFSHWQYVSGPSAMLLKVNNLRKTEQAQKKKMLINAVVFGCEWTGYDL